MVFKSFTHLARPSFSKALNHGYAQSVVAATQSSYASSTTSYPRSNKYGRPQTSQLHTAFQNASGQSTTPNKAGFATSNAVERKDGDPNLQGYYEALWKRQQGGEDVKEWTQFQFAKRIEWNPPSVVPRGRDFIQDDSGSHRSLDRAYSTSAVDDIKKAQDDAAEATALAKVDEAIAQTIAEIQDLSVSGNVSEQVTGQENVHELLSARAIRPVTPVSGSLVETASPQSDVTRATSVYDTDSHTFSENIAKLLEQRSYSQIPPVFEMMVNRGLKPTVKDYNMLLAAAVHLYAKHQVVPRALIIFSDMLGRKVEPDTAFYSSLLDLLAHRALDVVQMKATLDKKRLRFGVQEGQNSFALPSNEAEYEILLQDDALSSAVKVFRVSTTSHHARQYSPETYRIFVSACALHGCVDDMINAYNHMESHNVTPIASMFPLMIKAFAQIGDLNSAVECYNEYKSLAIADNAGQIAVIDRNDNAIYAAVVKAYAMCGKNQGGDRFLDKIIESHVDVTEQRKEKLEAIEDSVVLEAFVEDRLSAYDFAEALQLAEQRNLTPSVRSEAMAKVCIAAADHGDLDVATKAFQQIPIEARANSTAAHSLLALHIRTGDVNAARDVWAGMTNYDRSLIETTALYTSTLIRKGQIEEGITQAREAFGRIRASVAAGTSRSDVSEEIDEAIEFIGGSLVENGLVSAPTTRLSFLWAMVENGGLVKPMAEQILAGLGPQDIMNLGWQDVVLALQVEAGLIGNGEITRDIAHSARFAHLLEISLNSSFHLDVRTTGLVEKAFSTALFDRTDILNKWRNRTQMSDSYDPYAANTDYRGSTIITEELETRRNSAGLNEALLRFRNIRRAGRHPRYIAYAKLISAAAKEGRTNLIHDVLGMARTDVPFLPQYAVVRHGWSTILDSMVGACLTVGRRSVAAQFHQEMLDMGTAPTANTFGLYITTLKDSTKTFDEASEAVAIFGRAISEGVVPSSFLYNALIGKLGKARRIDDCLRYFQEMRAAGIRPTSVTYGTVVNALCRVSDDRFAEELFDEMESMPNYKPRPAPYNSLMQFYLTTKRDSQKVLSYYERMQSRNIQPTMHTYKLLIDTYATLEPVNLTAAEGVLQSIRAAGQRPEAVHYASLIHAKGCVLHDMEGARQIFDRVLANGDVPPQACLYQALFESMVANHCVAQTQEVLDHMSTKGVEMTPYIANTLIHGWAMENAIEKSKATYDSVSIEKREPSTYEAMTRAFLTAQNREGALATVHEMLSRGYPSAVSGKILELVEHGTSRLGNVML